MPRSRPWGIVQWQDHGFWCRLWGFESLCPSQSFRSSEYMFALGCSFKRNRMRNSSAKFENYSTELHPRTPQPGRTAPEARDAESLCPSQLPIVW